MNILADFQSAIHSINKVNHSLSDFKREARRIADLYDEDNDEPYIDAVDSFLSNLSYREMYLIIALLGDELRLSKFLARSEDKPSQVIEKLFFEPK